MQKPTRRNLEGELLTINQACEVFNLGATTIRQLAKECNAELKIGRSYRIRKDRLLEYIYNTFKL